MAASGGSVVSVVAVFFMRYDAFVSYRHSDDEYLARQLELAQRFAKA
jgi:hypothetical protein